MCTLGCVGAMHGEETLAGLLADDLLTCLVQVNSMYAGLLGGAGHEPAHHPHAPPSANQRRRSLEVPSTGGAAGSAGGISSSVGGALGQSNGRRRASFIAAEGMELMRKAEELEALYGLREDGRALAMKVRCVFLDLLEQALADVAHGRMSASGCSRMLALAQLTCQQR